MGRTEDRKLGVGGELQLFIPRKRLVGRGGLERIEFLVGLYSYEI